jgi:hypothetical protein
VAIAAAWASISTLPERDWKVPRHSLAAAENMALRDCPALANKVHGAAATTTARLMADKELAAIFLRGWDE